MIHFTKQSYSIQLQEYGPSQKWEVNAFSHLRIGITVFGVHQHIFFTVDVSPCTGKKFIVASCVGKVNEKLINTNSVREEIKNLTVANALFPHWALKRILP